MASRVASSLLRRIQTPFTRPERAKFHSNATRQGGGGSGGDDLYGDWVHRKHMYNLQEIPNRKLKWGLYAYGNFIVGNLATLWILSFSHSKFKPPAPSE